jgi:putative PIN family toxin of toxin-antitoxin system
VSLSATLRGHLVVVIAYVLPILMRIVLDTNIIVGALLREDGAARNVLRLCLSRKVTPLIGTSLFLEMEGVLGRDDIFEAGSLSMSERRELFAAFLSVAEWIKIYYTWRPNLGDESDNHIVELAVAGGAHVIVTQNLRDFGRAELSFPHLSVMDCRQFLQSWRMS